MSNKIIDIKFYEAYADMSKPIADSTHSIPAIKFIILKLITENGIEGESYMLSFHYSENAVKGMLADLKHFVEHKYEIDETEKFENDYLKESEYFGNEGLLMWSLALMNIAMWDAIGIEKNQPVWKILGGRLEPVSLYGSGGWLSYSIEELIEEAVSYKERGFQSIKVKVGSQDIEEDVERVAKVRETVGDDINIMIDANQGFSFNEALELIRKLERFQIHWFEEPFYHFAFSDYKNLYEKTNVSIAMGEREYNTVALKRLIELNAIDLWQPDIIRIGGVEAWRKSAEIAAKHNIPVLPHFYKDYDLPLLCTIPNNYAVESFDWIDTLIDNPLKVIDGKAFPREVPGWGFHFKKDKINELKVD